MEQVTHKHLDWTRMGHTSLREAYPIEWTLQMIFIILGGLGGERERERERNNFPFYVFGRKDKKVRSWKICLSFLYLVGKENQRKEIMICNNLLLYLYYIYKKKYLFSNGVKKYSSYVSSSFFVTYARSIIGCNF